ncbi:MAG: hypothetical protein NW207_01170 [Cytophagales bacterium]|nr:hypothetical protein [Cytophagales bacterium]
MLSSCGGDPAADWAGTYNITEISFGGLTLKATGTELGSVVITKVDSKKITIKATITGSTSGDVTTVENVESTKFTYTDKDGSVATATRSGNEMTVEITEKSGAKGTIKGKKS